MKAPTSRVASVDPSQVHQKCQRQRATDPHAINDPDRLMRLYGLLYVENRTPQRSLRNPTAQSQRHGIPIGTVTFAIAKPVRLRHRPSHGTDPQRDRFETTISHVSAKRLLVRVVFWDPHGNTPALERSTSNREKISSRALSRRPADVTGADPVLADGSARPTVCGGRSRSKKNDFFRNGCAKAACLLQMSNDAGSDPTATTDEKLLILNRSWFLPTRFSRACNRIFRAGGARYAC